MIVKRLRQKHNWSQEQLAILCGVSLRTIQRVEAGNQASPETLKSLASVFEIEISKLTEDIIVIDKESNEWKSEPWWVRILVLGVRKRRTYLIIEYFVVLIVVGTWFYDPMSEEIPILLFASYLSSKLVAYIDKKNFW